MKPDDLCPHCDEPLLRYTDGTDRWRDYLGCPACHETWCALLEIPVSGNAIHFKLADAPTLPGTARNVHPVPDDDLYISAIPDGELKLPAPRGTLTPNEIEFTRSVIASLDEQGQVRTMIHVAPEVARNMHLIRYVKELYESLAGLT